MSNMTEERRRRLATVYRTLAAYEGGGLPGVMALLEHEKTIVENDSWSDRIRKNLRNKMNASVEAELKDMLQKFKANEIKFDPTEGNISHSS